MGQVYFRTPPIVTFMSPELPKIMYMWSFYKNNLSSFSLRIDMRTFVAYVTSGRFTGGKKQICKSGRGRLQEMVAYEGFQL